MKYKLILICISIVIFTACSEKKGEKVKEVIDVVDTKNIFSDTSSSSVSVFDRDGRVCIQQTSTSYEIADFYEGSNRIPLLFKITKTDLCYADSSNKDKVFQISASSVMDTKQVKWDTRFVATEINFKDNSNTLLAIHEGVGEQEDVLTRYSLLDGKVVFQCSYGDLKASIPNVKSKRFLGFTSRNAVGKPMQELNVENILGEIEYSSSEGLIDKAIVKMKRSKVVASLPSYTPEMTLINLNSNTSVIEDGKTVILMKTDEHYTPKDIKDFGLRLTYYYGQDNEYTVIEIPVENDRLQVSKAKFDKDIFEISNY